MNTSQILGRIEYGTEEFEEAAVQAAILEGDGIVPSLIDLLMDCAERNTAFFRETAYTGHLYAIHILSELREPEAHIPLLQLCTAPALLVEAMFSDAFLDNELNRALAATADGDVWGLVRLIEDPGVHHRVRRAAVIALQRIAFSEEADRSTIIDCLEGLFLHLKREPSMMWEYLCDFAELLCATELLKHVHRAWKERLITGDWDDIASYFRKDWQTERVVRQQNYEKDEWFGPREWWIPNQRPASSGFCQPVPLFDRRELNDFESDEVQDDEEEDTEFFDEDEVWD